MATALLAACGGGGGGGSSVGSSVGAVMPATAPEAPVTVSMARSVTGAARMTASSGRSVQSMPESTTTVYLALQTSPGHGSPTYSFKRTVSSTNCSVSDAGDYCSFTIKLPVGNDTVSILATGGNGKPVAYSAVDGAVNVTQSGTNTIEVGNFIGPVIAKVVPSYVFEPFLSTTSSSPVVVFKSYDSSGGQDLGLSYFAEPPFSFAYFKSITVTQTKGTFSLYTTGSIPQLKSGPEQTASLDLGSPGAQAIVEDGTGKNKAFTTTVTATNAKMVFRKTQFPSLDDDLTLPEKSRSITLTCTFASGPPFAADPCQGAAVPVAADDI
jgi:hypothetical protein